MDFNPESGLSIFRIYDSQGSYVRKKKVKVNHAEGIIVIHPKNAIENKWDINKYYNLGNDVYEVNLTLPIAKCKYYKKNSNKYYHYPSTQLPFDVMGSINYKDWDKRMEYVNTAEKSRARHIYWHHYQFYINYNVAEIEN